MIAQSQIVAMGDVRLRIAPGVAIAKLAIGRPANEVLDLLPRVFNLCQSPQRIALRLALGWPDEAGAREALRAELLRDHLLRFGVMLPARLGLAPTGIAGISELELRKLFLGNTPFPSTLDAFDAFLAGPSAVAQVLKALRHLFAAGEAAIDVLPKVDPANPLQPVAAENSCAERHAKHSVMRAIESHWGRGPFWRATGRALDLESCLNNRLPGARRLDCGTVMVPASRGAYLLAATAENGVVTSLKRVTPTDHMLAPRGMMIKTLEALPANKRHLAPLVIDILDPCTEVKVLEVEHA